MKCEGAEDPPCERCRKSGRECVLPSPGTRQIPPQGSEASSTGTTTAISQGAPINLPGRSTGSHQLGMASSLPPPNHTFPPQPRSVQRNTQNRKITETASVHSTHAVNSRIELSSQPSTSTSGTSVKRKRYARSTPGSEALSTPGIFQSQEEGIPISKKEMRDMIHL